MKPKRVLVIDDSPTITKVVQITLAKRRYEVITAPGGEAGVAKAKEERPDLILLDWVMPDIGGDEVLVRLRADPTTEHIPVVLISAKGDALGHLVGEQGVVDAITKPFPAEGLLAVTEHALERFAGAGLDSNAIEVDLDVDVAFEASLDKTPADAGGYDIPGRVIDAISEDARAAGRDTRNPRAAVAALRRELAARTVESVVEALRGAEGSAEELEQMAGEAISRALPDETLSRCVQEMLRQNPHFYTDDGIGIMGDLACINVAEVFRLIAAQQLTGLMHILRDDSRVEVSFNKGRIELAIASGYEDEFLLGRFILEANLMARADLDNFLASRDGASKLLGRQLVKLGFIEAEGLRAAIRRQTVEILYELLRWDTGQYHFHNNRKLGPLAVEAALQLPVEAVLLEGIRRVDEWYLIEQKVRDFESIFTRNESVINELGWDQFTKEESQLLELVNGKNTVREILKKSRMGSYNVSRGLYRLLQIGAIRPRVAPVAV